MIISIEDIRSKYVPEGTNPASFKQKDFLENLVGDNGVLRNSRDYSTYWDLADISGITAKDAYVLADFLKNRNIAFFIRDIYLQYPSGVIDTDKFGNSRSLDCFHHYMETGILPLMVNYLRISRIRQRPPA